MKGITIKLLTINNKPYQISSDQNTTLIDVLRNELKLTGTKRGCNIGVCGTCTILINGVAKKACKTIIKNLKETDDIVTIEGLSKDGKLHPVQQAFIDAGAVQCGFCTPGMIMNTISLLNKNPKPTREEIIKAFAGNLCRCTGYEQIINAVLRAGGPENRSLP